MIRMEIKTEHKRFVSAEGNMKDAKAYIKGMEDNGVIIESVEYFDLDIRVEAIRRGEWAKQAGLITV